MDSAHIASGSIVVGVDGSSWSEEALDWAIDQAALEGRALTIVHSAERIGLTDAGFDSPVLDYGRLMDDIRIGAQELLADAASRALARRPGIDVEQVLSFSDPRSALLDLGTEAALIVVGSRGRGQVASLLLGSVSVSLVRHAACPVVVRRPIDPTRTTQGILVGIDGTERSMPAIEFAYRMASARQRPLIVLHAYWEAPVVAGGSATPDLVGEQALVAERLSRMSEKFPDVAVEIRLARGFADQLLIAASRDHELVVVGHHPIPLLNDLIYGSVAPSVVEHAHAAVAVVPSGSIADGS